MSDPTVWKFVYTAVPLRAGSRYRRVDGLPTGILTETAPPQTFLDRTNRVKYLVGRGIESPSTDPAFIRGEEVVNFEVLEVGGLYEMEDGTRYFITSQCDVQTVPPMYQGVSASHSPHKKPDVRFFRADGRSVGGKVNLFRKLY